MRIFKWECKQIVSASRNVVQWNYMDGEHLSVVHGGYSSVDLLYEDGHNSFGRAFVRIPVLRFIRVPTTIFVSFPDSDTQVTYAHQLFIWSKTTIHCEELDEYKTQVTMTYEFELSGWRRFLHRPLKLLVPRWNEQVWKEDLPLKLRRQQMLDLGFVDFVGLPHEKPSSRPQQTNLILPIRRPPDSPIAKHPFFQRTSTRTSLQKQR